MNALEQLRVDALEAVGDDFTGSEEAREQVAAVLDKFIAGLEAVEVDAWADSQSIRYWDTGPEHQEGALTTIYVSRKQEPNLRGALRHVAEEALAADGRTMSAGAFRRGGKRMDTNIVADAICAYVETHFAAAPKREADNAKD